MPSLPVHILFRSLVALTVVCALMMPSVAAAMAAPEECCEQSIDGDGGLAGGQEEPAEETSCGPDCARGCCSPDAVATGTIAALLPVPHTPTAAPTASQALAVAPEQPIPPPRA